MIARDLIRYFGLLVSRGQKGYRRDAEIAESEDFENLSPRTLRLRREIRKVRRIYHRDTEDAEEEFFTKSKSELCALCVSVVNFYFFSAKLAPNFSFTFAFNSALAPETLGKSLIHS